MIDITNRKTLFEVISFLQPDDMPVFGEMTPQHMVEHLARSVAFSNGNEIQNLYYPAMVAEKMKQSLIYTEVQMPVGFKSPVLPENGLPELVYTSLSDAIQQLQNELSTFDHYFNANPNSKPTSPHLVICLFRNG